MDVPSADPVLAQPTRARVFECLLSLGRPAGTEELGEHLGLHPNGVRIHLDRLRAAGLVARDRVRQGVGRPRDLWMVAPDAEPGGEPPRAYTDLGRWLTAAMVRNRTSLRAIESTGRQIGRGLAPDDEAAGEQGMFGTLVSLGFQPRRERQEPDGLTYHLENCPYRAAVREGRQVVCTLHRGITRGMLDEIDPRTELVDFVPRDPETAGCLVELRGGLARAVSPSAPATDES